MSSFSKNKINPLTGFSPLPGVEPVVLEYTSATGWHYIPTPGGGGGVLNNYVAVTAPTVNSDTTAGYAVGSAWVNTATGVTYRCVDATAGAAVWVVTSNALDNFTAVAAPTVNDDATAGYSVGSQWIDTVTGTIYQCVDATAGAAVWKDVSVSPTAFLRYTREIAVAGAGTLYLRTGEGLVTSVIGDNLPDGGFLKGISYVVDTVDAARTYTIEVFRPAAGTTIPGATLAVPLSTKSDRRRDLNIALAPTDEIGVRIVRTAGAGSSTFTNINVVLEIEVP